MTYDTDVAYIHDAGFSSYALNVAPGILRYLRQYDAAEGLVVDLGCGSGVLARQLAFAGHRVLGIDLSESMLAIARQKAPAVEFRQGSLFKAKLPKCSAVLCLGEVLSYAAASTRGEAPVRAFFRRVFRALAPGGIFLIDYGQPGRFPAGMPRHSHWTGKDWAILIDTKPHDDPTRLIRHLTAFRKTGSTWRRSEETHRLKLFPGDIVPALLEEAGFPAPIALRSLGDYRFHAGHSAAIAQKPAAA